MGIRAVLYSENVLTADRITTDQKGAIAETAIAHRAVRRGIGVSRPVNEGERYDLIFDLRPRLIRVQCKWASLDGDVISVRCLLVQADRRGHDETPLHPR